MARYLENVSMSFTPVHFENELKLDGPLLEALRLRNVLFRKSPKGKVPDWGQNECEHVILGL